MKVVDGYFKPILEQAVEKARGLKTGGSQEPSELNEDDTLLDHLVRFTTGTAYL